MGSPDFGRAVDRISDEELEIMQGALLESYQYLRLPLPRPALPAPESPKDRESESRAKPRAQSQSKANDPEPAPKNRKAKSSSPRGRPRGRPRSSTAPRESLHRLSNLSLVNHASAIEETEEETEVIPDHEEQLAVATIPAKTIDVIRMEDNEETLDKFGLPLDINSRFSRWLYADLRAFQPGSLKAKSEKDEVFPPPTVKVLVFCNDISDLKAPLLTQDLKAEEQPGLEEIPLPKIKIRPSSSLVNAHAEASQGIRNVTTEPSVEQQEKDTAKENGSATTSIEIATKRKKSKPKITLTLETQRITIDRRPMLKRLKACPGILGLGNNDSNGEVSSTSLIGPGEDCDDSDEIECVEIDCD